MAQLCPKELCVGCGACASVCPKNAIEMQFDRHGFAYPTLNAEACVHCGKCTRVCPTLSPPEHRTPLAVRAFSADSDSCMGSSSGAFFPTLALHLLQQGYYVCGVVYDEDYLGAHYCITRSQDDVLRMRKSKYFEAKIGTAYQEIDALLQAGEKVLFTGTPCHVAGLLNSVRNGDNLLTAELFCYGSGSPYLYKELIKSFVMRENYLLSDLKNVDFRHKPCQLNAHILEVRCADQTYIFEAEDFPYYRGFVHRLLFRDSCYACQYNRFERIADITMADSVFSDAYAHGESLVFGNTEKGETVLAALRTTSAWREATSQEIEQTKQNRFKKESKPRLRQKVMQCDSVARLENTYLKAGYCSFPRKIYKKLRQMLKV